jgi:hypothetical protein
MTVVGVLEGALAKLRRDGWTQYTFGAGSNEPCCLVGALAWQLGGLLQQIEVIKWLGYDDTQPDPAFVGALMLLGDVIGVREHTPRLTGNRLSCWNDFLTGRSFADVEGALLAAIEIAQQQAQDSPAPSLATVEA